MWYIVCTIESCLQGILALSKRVLILITKGEIGGATRHVVDLSIGLFERGYDVNVVYGGRESDWLGNQLSNIPRIKVFSTSLLVNKISPIHDFIFSIWFLIFCFKNKPDILHIHSSKAGFIGRVLGTISRIPKIVFTVHGSSFQPEYGKLNSTIYGYAEQFAYYCCDKIIFVSNYDQRLFETKIRDDKDKFTIIKNSLRPKANFERDRKTPKSEPIVTFGYLGRYSFPKNPEVLLFAFSEIRNRTSQDIRVILKGGGKDEEMLVKLSEKLGLNDYVSFEPFDDKIEDFLNRIDALVLCSKFEGYPYVLLEGKSAGCFLISSNVGGCSEIVTNACGSLFNALDPKDLASKMLEYIEEDRRKFQPFYEGESFGSFINDICNVYEE